MKKYNNLIVILIYLALTLVFTIPVIFKVNTDIPGECDAFDLLVSSGNRLQNSSPLDIAKSIFPFGIFSHATHLLLLHLIFGEPLAYNILWLSSFVLASFGAYLLVRYLTKNKIAAFISGFIYGFAPIHFAYGVGYGGATHIEWIPFFVLFLIKYFHRPCLKNILLSCLFFMFVISNEPHFAAYTILFTIIIFIYYLITKKELFKNKKFIRYTSVALILIVAFTVYNYRSMIRIATSESNYLDPGLKQAEHYSADALSPFTPSFLHPIWGDFFQRNIAYKFTGNPVEYTVYLGFAVLFFSLYALIFRRRDKIINFWAISGLLFYIFSIGPFLHFWGPITPKIPMPYLFLYRYIPFFSNIRASGRMFIIAMLSFSVLAGFGIKYFLEKYNSQKRFKLIMPSIIFLVILFEFCPIPYITSNLDRPPFYTELGSQSEDFAILQIPGSTHYCFASKILYYKTIHKKKTINDYDFARDIPGRLDFQKKTPVIRDLLYEIPTIGDVPYDIIKHPYPDIAPDILNYYNTRYIIIHKDYIGPRKKLKIPLEDYIYLRNFIKENINATVAFEDEKMVAFEIKKKQEISPYFLTLGENWEKIERKDEQVARWAKNEASLNLTNLSQEDKKFKLDISVQTERGFRRLDVSINDHSKGSYIITPKKRIIRLFLSDIHPGENIVKFNVYDGNDKPINEKDKTSSIKFSNISYKEIDEITIPDLYQNIIKEEGEFSILSVPFYTNYSFDGEELEDKKIEGKKIISPIDFIREDPEGNKRMENRGPILDELLFSSKLDLKELNSTHDIFSNNYYLDIIKRIPTYYNIKYIVLYKEQMDSDEFSYYKDLIERFLEIEETKEDDILLVYNVKRLAIDKPSLFLGDNWSSLARKDTPYPYRKPFNEASLILINPYPDKRDMKFSFRTWTCDKQKPRFLLIFLNGNWVATHTIVRDHTIPEIDLKKVEPGENIISFRILDEQSKYIESRDVFTAVFRDLKIK